MDLISLLTDLRSWRLSVYRAFTYSTMLVTGLCECLRSVQLVPGLKWKKRHVT